MTPVKTAPRFRCAYCAKISSKSNMTRHEKRCFFNPNRFCDICRNTGIAGYDYYSKDELECHACVKCDNIRRDIRRDYEDGRATRAGTRWLEAQDALDAAQEAIR